MERAAVEQVRSFHRTVAESIGAIGERFLGRARPMGESRLLWEIGREGIEVRALRRRLELDSGYVSRTLRSLERQGLVVVRANPKDRRVRRAELTRAGRRERHHLDRRSDELAAGILETLDERQRATLVGAMGEVERLLKASFVRFAIDDAGSAEAAWCLKQYFDELGGRFEEGFDPARSISADARELTPPAGCWMLARLHETPVGCGALKFHGKSPAELKRMWVSPSVRGLGIGRRLLEELEQQARKAGASLVRLETNRSLKEAIALYRRAGYVEVGAFNAEPYAHHWFEKRLS